MEMKIPKSFKLLGRTIKVVYDPVHFHENPEFNGFACYKRNEIQLRPSTVIDPLNDEQLMATFCHELVHFILYHAGPTYVPNKNEFMHQNEALVDLCGDLLHQALTTMEYDGVGGDDK